MDAARSELVAHGPGELSVRAVAREVGIAPSGIYRYYASREHLVAALALDAYTSAANALGQSLADSLGSSVSGQALAMAHDYRRWALARPAEFSLLFGTEVCGDTVQELDADRLAAFFTIPLAHFALAVEEGAVDTDAATMGRGTAIRASVAQLRRAAHGLDEHQVAILVSGWTAVHGFVMLELFGPLVWVYADPHDAFDQHARATLRAMGHRGL